MKTGFRLFHKYRMIYAYVNLIRFNLKKYFLGFDVANIFVQHIDKISLQLILKRNGAQIGNKCDIETGLIFHNCHNYKNLNIGNNCHIGKNCFFDLRDRIIIDDNVVISMQCSFFTHLDMSKSILSKEYPSSSSSIHISNNVYIGARSIILKSVDIGEKALVAASSTVMHNVSPFTMVAGTPAKLIKNLP